MRSMSQLLDEFTQYVRSCSDELPKTVDEAMALLGDHSEKYKNLKDSIINSSMRGEELLRDMKRGKPTSDLPPSSVNNVSALER